MEKVIRNGMVAVLYSPGYGAGWITWNRGHNYLLFHPDLVEAVERMNDAETKEEEEIIQQEIEKIAHRLCIKYRGEDDDVYTGGAEGLTIEWISEGYAFEVKEYDGYESIQYLGDGIFVA